MTEIRVLPACCGCGTTPPPSEDDSDASSLLSMRFGWRVVRQVDANGNVSAQWRCPSCWDRYKASRPTKTKPPIKRGP